MARSEEAILRRALKRQRTEGEQRCADRMDMNRQALKRKQKMRPSNREQSPNNKQWKSGNEGLSARSVRKPRVPNQSRPSSRQRIRHDEATSKKLVWAEQADSAIVSKNQELRQRYRDTNGVGMDPSDVERAKLLLARDERKRQRKNTKKSSLITPSKEKELSKSENVVKQGPMETETAPSGETSTALTNGKEKDGVPTNQKTIVKSSSSQSKRDQNKALKDLYKKTGGTGMKAEQIERAKVLLARDETKRKRRQKQMEKA